VRGCVSAADGILANHRAHGSSIGRVFAKRKMGAVIAVKSSTGSCANGGPAARSVPWASRTTAARRSSSSFSAN